MIRFANDKVGITAKRFDRAIEWLLISLLAFMPFSYGAVQAWSEEVVIAFTAAISICFLLKLVFRKDTDLVWSWAYIPVALLLLVAVLQLIPLPTGVVQIISPNTAAIKKELLSDLPNACPRTNCPPNARAVLPTTAIGAGSSMTLSFYPHATTHELRLVLAVAAVFVVTLNICRQPERIKRLLAAIAIIGAAVAVLALLQDLFGNGKIYWFVRLPSQGQAYSGPFINHSHFGQFMNLSIGAALGLIMVKLHEAFTGKKVTPPVVAEYLSSPQAKVTWLLIVMVILGAASIFVSLTRGGMVSMLIAGGITALMLSSRKSLKGRGWIMVLIALGAFICVLYIGFDAVYDRLATLRELHQYKGRWQIVKDIAIAWTKFPLLGTGLGTHEVVYPMFDRSTIPALASHAENEYAQAAEETGIIGLAILVVFAIVVWVNYVRNVRSPLLLSVPRPSWPCFHGLEARATLTQGLIRSAAYGLGFGLMAIMLHSFSDFGQHLPANSMLSAVSCALLIGLENIESRTRNFEVRDCRFDIQYSSGFPLYLLSFFCLLTVWAWAILGANSARLAEAHWKKALIAEGNLRQKDWQGTNDEFRELISQAAAAADYQPENVIYRHWLNVYRWYSISRIVDPNTGQVIIPQQLVHFVHRIVDELHAARVLCPVFGPAYCVAGQLEKSVLNDPNGVKHIQTGYLLAPCDATTCFVAGILDAEAPASSCRKTEARVDAAFAKLCRALKLDGSLFREIAGVFINQLDRPDLAVKLAGDNTDWLSQAANLLSEPGGQAELTTENAETAEEKSKLKISASSAPSAVKIAGGKSQMAKQARTRVVELLKLKCRRPDAPAWALASLANICARENDYDAAIENYRRALALDYSQVQWRFTLAMLLAKTDRIDEAIREARICLRIRPEFNAAEGLIADLSVRQPYSFGI